MRQLALYLTVSLLGAGRMVAQTPPIIAIRNARIVTVSSGEIAKGTVVIRNGLIEAVGENLPEPAGAWVIAGEGLTVYPGLIDALSPWGLPSSTQAQASGRGSGAAAPAVAGRPGTPGQAAPPARGPEDRPFNTSFLRAADLIDPGDRRLEAARSAGFTSAVVFPTQGIFAGQGAVLNLAGARAGQMVVQSPAGLYVSLRSGGFGSGFPASLMGVIAYVRQVLLDAEHYQLAKAFYAENPRGNRRPEYDKTLEGVLAAPRVLLPAVTEKEIARMLAFAGERKLSAVLYGLHEGFRAAERIKAGGLPVLVSLKWPEKDPESDPEAEESYRTLELQDKAPSTPAAFEKAGVRFAFYSDGIERPADVLRAVKRALDAGLTAEGAVRAMTLSAAEIYGVADRLGSIEKGKIANLVVTKGPLFQEGTQVKYVFIDGVKYEPSPAESAPARQEVTR